MRSIDAEQLQQELTTRLHKFVCHENTINPFISWLLIDTFDVLHGFSGHNLTMYAILQVCIFTQSLVCINRKYSALGMEKQKTQHILLQHTFS